MATIIKGYTFGATETVTNAKLHALVDSATITNIVNADVGAGAAIAFSKITQANIDGSLLTGLANIVSGAGVIPIANIPSIPNSSLTVGVGTSANNILALNASAKIPAVDGSLLTGLSTGKQFFTSSGTFTAPTGVTTVWLTMVGSGGGGGAYNYDPRWSGGGGGGGAIVYRARHTVVAGSNYTVTIGAAGTGGVGTGGAGGAGGNVVFDTLTVTGGAGGGSYGGAGGAGGAQLNQTMTGAGGGSQTGGARGYLSYAGGTGGAGQQTGGGEKGAGGGGSHAGIGGAGGAPGANATGYGAGGGGGDYNANGGNGTAGFVSVEF